MENDPSRAMPEANTQTSDTKATYAVRGALIGSSLGLLAVWSIVSGTIDPNVTEHKPIFSFAVLMVCSFAVFVWLFFTCIGCGVGACIKQVDSSIDDSSRDRKDLAHDAEQCKAPNLDHTLE